MNEAVAAAAASITVFKTLAVIMRSFFTAKIRHSALVTKRLGLILVNKY